MLRIELDAQDLGHIRFAEEPSPAVETSLMLLELRQRAHMIHDRSMPDERGTGWRRSASAVFTSTARALLPLSPTPSCVFFLDVLTTDPDEIFELVRDLPLEVAHAYAQRVPAAYYPVSEWVRRYDEGDSATRTQVVCALRSFHGSCLAPRWPQVTAAFHRDQHVRTTLMRNHGVVAMLNTLSPDLRLNGLALEGRHPWERRVRLGGHGLLLIPSAFWTGYPLVIRYDYGSDEESARYALVYPARCDPALSALGDYGLTASPRRDPLTLLLGQTRAEILRALRRPHTTSTLAHHIGVSPAAASTHTGILRAAGLITSERHVQTVVHSITELGSTLIWQGF